jgi:membrane associated rhomboid family serine protease
MTLTLIVVSAAQYIYKWDWALSGSMEGTTRMQYAIASVFAHDGYDHFVTNMVGAAVLLSAAELLVSRRWLAVAATAVVVDSYVFTAHYTALQGASALVLAGTGLLVALLPGAWGALSQGAVRRAQLLTTAAFSGVFCSAVMLYIAIMRLGDDDGVAHRAHIHGSVIGLIFGTFLAVRGARSLLRQGLLVRS